MRSRVVASFVVLLASVVLHSERAEARGRAYLSPCERGWSDDQRATDECGVFADLHLNVQYLARPPDIGGPVSYGRTTSFAAVPTTYIGGGVGTGYLFRGDSHLGIRFFDVEGGFSAVSTYAGDPHGTSASFTGDVDISGLLFHGRRETEDGYWSYLVGFSPNLAFVQVLPFAESKVATSAPFLGERTDVRGCFGRGFRMCLAVGANVYQFGRFMNGGTLAIEGSFVR